MFRLLALLLLLARPARADDPAFQWPTPTREMRPWTYNWWMGSAVDETNLTRELTRYAEAGLGGIHIIPIYGVTGAEARAISYLSPRWMDILSFTVAEAGQRGLGVDLTLGTGWCFGGPWITPEHANVQTTNGVTFKPTMKVKRAAPGGGGWMMNPLSAAAMDAHLRPFTDAFAAYTGPRPRAVYHDSYEYRANWAPELLAEFERRRGYRLQDEFDALFGTNRNDHVARVKGDYRETLSDLMIEDAWPRWSAWAKARGFLTRNEAHGAPGNWLDLYALADMPETEMFHKDRNQLVSLFASSAAHHAGRKLVSAETGTWLAEHFQETLGGLKELFDDLFLSGVNHLFYHGTCYSPDDAPWPGWLFYASTEMNPRNAIWHDAPALNTYATRCQSMLQQGRLDPDFLVYWPIYDLWHNPAGLEMNLTVHARDWLEGQPVGTVAKQLRAAGRTIAFVSDRQLTALPAARSIVVPPCEHLPPATLARLLELKAAGTHVYFVDRLPAEPPGAGRLAERRAEMSRLLARARAMKLEPVSLAKLAGAPLPAGLQCIRRRVQENSIAFVANRGAEPFAGWVHIGVFGPSVILMDPLSGRIGTAAQRDLRETYLRLAPGASLIVRSAAGHMSKGPAWTWWDDVGAATELRGDWQVEFVAGGPELPPAFTTNRLGSWTAQGGEAERFAGTARYSLTFDAPPGDGPFALDLGRVAESARVRLNGTDLGTLIQAPYRVMVVTLKPIGNVLEVEVTNLSANRIRDLDMRKVPWRKFHEINFVNIDYKPFDAAIWPVRESGLLGPVTLTAVQPAAAP